MAKEKQLFKRYDLPLEYYLDHEFYYAFYNLLIPEVSNLQHLEVKNVELIHIYNDTKFYLDTVLTSKYPELTFPKADTNIKNEKYLHVSNSYYSYIVRLLFYIGVYANARHTESMFQSLVWTHDNLMHDPYFHRSVPCEYSLADMAICSFSIDKFTFLDSNSEEKMTYTTKSSFYDLDREYKEEAEEIGTISALEPPTLTMIVEGINEDFQKDKRQKLPLTQNVVLEILRKLCIKAGYNPKESTNMDFARFCCLMTPYSVQRVNANYKFDSEKSFIGTGDLDNLKELQSLIEKLGIDLKLS